ncbi:MAG: fused MFS/spermidine synthase [Planctomycetota bacterium]|nr:fused MFS/spermidine synthase [Planctomycetota bacterium]
MKNLTSPTEDVSALDDSPAPTWADRATWFGLAMVASVMLLATTNQVCLDIATVPFLWIQPLTLYLMSFILCFDADRWYSRNWYVALLVLSLLAVVKTLLSGSTVSIVLQVSIYLSAMFFCCMVCHGELSRQKPGSRHLTQFFLLMSAGGAGGRLFVGLLAPSMFPAYWELHIGIVACLLVTLLVLFRDRTSYFYQGQPRPAWMMIALWVSILAWSLQSHAREGVQSAIEVSRNFYGVLQIEDALDGDTTTNRRGMFHGSILHGTQFLAEDKRKVPTTYYGTKSGVGLVMQYHRVGLERRIGVVGLGVGTLATYGQKDDLIRFYEINPEVIRLAKRYFTFLSATESTTDMILGDARLSLEHEEPQNYDILVLDAFSGDAIPTHLLTREAAHLYKRHLSDDGVLCIHISNLHFDLRPVVLGLGNDIGLHSVCVQSSADTSQGTTLCHWMLLSRQPIPKSIVSRAEELDELGESELLWTDEWSNLLSVLR